MSGSAFFPLPSLTRFHCGLAHRIERAPCPRSKEPLKEGQTRPSIPGIEGRPLVEERLQAQESLAPFVGLREVVGRRGETLGRAHPGGLSAHLDKTRGLDNGRGF